MNIIKAQSKLSYIFFQFSFFIILALPSKSFASSQHELDIFLDQIVSENNSKESFYVSALQQYIEALIQFEKYKDLDQVKWQDQFLHKKEFIQILNKLEEDFYQRQEILNGIERFEHNGAPSKLELKLINKEIFILETLIELLAEKTKRYETLSHELQNEVQTHLQLKLEQRELIKNIKNAKSFILKTLESLKRKISFLENLSRLDTNHSYFFDILKFNYNRLIIQLTIERLAQKVPSKVYFDGIPSFLESFSLIFKTNADPDEKLMPPLIIEALDFMYLEFETNDTSAEYFPSLAVNLKYRIKLFEELLFSLKFSKYESPTKKINITNGFQEIAYYLSRMYGLQETLHIHKIQSLEDLKLYLKAVKLLNKRKFSIQEFENMDLQKASCDLFFK